MQRRPLLQWHLQNQRQRRLMPKKRTVLRAKRKNVWIKPWSKRVKTPHKRKLRSKKRALIVNCKTKKMPSVNAVAVRRRPKPKNSIVGKKNQRKNSWPKRKALCTNRSNRKAKPNPQQNRQPPKQAPLPQQTKNLKKGFRARIKMTAVAVVAA